MATFLNINSNAILAHSKESFLNRILGVFFPPAPLGKVGKSTLDYDYRMGRTEGFERHSVAEEINMYVKVCRFQVGEAKPVYQRGTRERRAELLNEEV